MPSDIKTPKVFVIILNFNGQATLSDCLTSVFKSNYKNFEVIVVDNDSTDGSFEKARNNFSRANFIKNSANVGFARGNNVAIRYALEKFADAIFVLNNDAIIKSDTITNLVIASEKNTDAGILSPVIMKTDGKSIWFAGGKIDWKKMRTIHLFEKESENPYSSEYISGCAMFIKKEVFNKVGLFDERYFLYYEDADFSVRTRLSGFNLLMIPSQQIIHYEQSEKSDSKNYWLVLSGLIFFRTHAKLSQKLWLLPYLSLRKIKNLYDIFFSRSLSAKDVRKAYTDFRKMKNI